MSEKKIRLVLALDGEAEYTQALSNAKKNSNLLKTELKNLSSQFEGNANSIAALKAKQETLTKVQKAYQEEVNAAKAGLDNAVKQYDKQSDKLEELKKRLEEAKKAQEQMEKSGDTTSEAYKDQCKQVEELDTAVQKQTVNVLKASGRTTDWNTKIAQSENNLRNCNKALDQNEQYLKEAESATDGCAISIDQFGKEVGEAAEEVKDASDKTSTFRDMLKANLTSTAIVGALKKIADAGKEAAEYVIEVGSSFESAMSEVAAISGADDVGLEAMTEKAKELGSSTKFSATEAAEAFKYMALAGWDTNTMLQSIDGVLNLAAASGMELANASDLVTDYLSAFNMEASQSAYMADLLAYAQANSNTTVEQLGEAFGNCAAILNAGGQDIETVTSLLEGMANQGVKGSEAGTALSSVMTQITQKMKDGKIAIGETEVAVADSNGNFRDLTDILVDVEGALEGMGTQERSAALAATFNKTALSGLNTILNEGMTNISNYETALRNSEGAASDMATTMQDNLAGKVTEFNSALEGLGIQVYEYISGPAQAVVETATGAINAITEAITPQRTELDQLVEDTEKANKELQTSIENGKASIENAELEAGRIQELGNQLLALNGVEDKSLAQRYQLKKVVQELGESIPEIAAAYDEEAGKVELTDSMVQNLISSTTELMVAQAAQAAMQENINALVEAQVQYDAAKKAAEDADMTVAYYQEQIDALEDLYDRQAELSQVDFDEQWVSLMEGFGYEQQLADGTLTLTNAFGFLNDQMYEAQGTSKAAHKEMDDLNETITSGKEEINAYSDATEEIVEGLTKSREGVGQLAEDMSNGLIPAMEDVAQSTLSVNDNLVTGAKSSEEFTDATKAMAEASGTATTVLGEEDDALEDVASAAELAADAQKEAMRSVLDTYHGYVSEIEADLQNKINVSEKFDAGEAINTGEMLSNLESSVEGLTEYKESLTRFVDEVGGEIAPEFMQYLMDLSNESPEIMNNLVDALDTDYGLERIKAMSDEYMEALDLDSEIAEIEAGNKTALDAAMGELGSSEYDFSDLRESIEEAKASAVQGWSGLSEETAAALDEAVNAAEEKGVAIPDGLAESIASGEVDVEGAIASLTGAIEGMDEGLAAVAEESGSAVAEGYANGIVAGQSDAETAGGTLNQAAIDSFRAGIAEAQAAGEEQAKAFAQAIKDGEAQARQASEALANAARAGIESNINGFYSAGLNMSQGVASGIAAGQSNVITAATNMARQALAAAEAAVDIHSPSRAFRKDVGQQIGKGTAFGIDDTASLASNSAARMSLKVYSSATAWLKKYKASHKTSLEDEAWYWEQVAKHAQAGTSAYNKAITKMLKASVSTTTTTGSGKNKKTVKKDAETYYSEILSAAQTYAGNQQILNDWSLERQLAYWKNVRKQLKSGTQAWYDATSEIKDLQQEIADAAKEKLQTQATVQQSILDKYKVYNSLSAKAEMDYWDTARKQFAEGTDERIDADQKYLEAKEEYYGQLAELDEDYAESSKEVNEQLADSIKELEEAYEDAVSSRKSEIMSSMSLFESWDSGGYTKDVLTANLKTQVEGLKFWEEQLEELSKKNVSQELLDELAEMGPDAAASLWSLNQMTAEELEEYNKLYTEKSELAQKQAKKDNEALWKETQDSIAEAKRLAQEELLQLEADYNAAVLDLNTGLSDGLKSLVDQAANIGEDIVSALINAINKNSTSESISAAVSGIINGSATSTASNTSSTGSSGTDKILSIIKSGTKRSKKLSADEEEAHHSLWKYLVQNYGYKPSKKTYQSLASELGVSISDDITSAEKNKILKKLKNKGYAKGTKRIDMEDEYWVHPGELIIRQSDGGILQRLGAGDGVIPADLASNLWEWGEKTPADFLEDAKASMAAQQAALQAQMEKIDPSGISALNRAMLDPQPQTTIVNVDNREMVAMMQQVLTGMQDMIEAFSGMQMVMDNGVVAGQLQPLISRETAAVTIRRRRGKL